MRCFIAFLLALSFHIASAQSVPKEVTLVDFIKESQQMKLAGHNMKLVWWVPEEFWDVVANDNPSIRKSDMEAVKSLFSGYTMVIAIAGTRTSENSEVIYDFMSYDEMKPSIQLIDVSNVQYRPLEDKDISNEILGFRERLKPIFTNSLGALGKGANVFFFKTEAGVNTTSAAANARFKVILDAVTFNWNAPMPCLMPAKYCPVDDLKMKGDWIYCPYHGVKLDK
jgi:hypothetical protein